MKKKLLLTCTVALTSLTIQAAPTIYGSLNKDLRYIDQEDVHHRSTFSVVDEVSNAPSRLGVKGTHELDGVSIDYKFEMGIGTSALGIRHAHAYIGNKMYGKVVIGQDFTALSRVGGKFDPLADTAVGLAGIHQASNIANAVSKRLGYFYRGRNNLLGYQSPNIAGFQLLYTRDDKQVGGTADRARGHATNNSTSLPTHNEILVTYKNKFGGVGLDVYAGYAIGEGPASDKAYDSLYTVGAKAMFGQISVSALYSMEMIEQMQTTKMKEDEKSYMMASAAYKMGAHTVAATYGAYSEDVYYNDTQATTKDRNQMALGYKYALGKNAVFNVTASQYSVEYKKDGVTGDAKKLLENDATTFGTGVRIFF
jgi:hypothetical protein